MVIKSLDDIVEQIDAFNGDRFPINVFIQKVNELQKDILEALRGNESLVTHWRFLSPQQIKWFKEELVVLRTFLAKCGDLTVSPKTGEFEISD